MALMTDTAVLVLSARPTGFVLASLPRNRCTFTRIVRAGHRASNLVIAEDATVFDRFGPALTLVDAVGGSAHRVQRQNRQRSRRCDRASGRRVGTITPAEPDPTP